MSSSLRQVDRHDGLKDGQTITIVGAERGGLWLGLQPLGIEPLL